MNANTEPFLARAAEIQNEMRALDAKLIFGIEDEPQASDRYDCLEIELENLKARLFDAELSAYRAHKTQGREPAQVEGSQVNAELLAQALTLTGLAYPR